MSACTFPSARPIVCTKICKGAAAWYLIYPQNAAQKLYKAQVRWNFGTHYKRQTTFVNCCIILSEMRWSEHALLLSAVSSVADTDGPWSAAVRSAAACYL